MMRTARPTPLQTPTVPARASLYLKWHGKEIRRAHGFLRGHRITCPDGHTVNEPARFFEDGTLFCGHRATKAQQPCGALIYVLVIPGRGERRRIWVADCTRDELTEIERLGLDPDGVLAYFGAAFTR
jgi:hypothetical protein